MGLFDDFRVEVEGEDGDTVSRGFAGTPSGLDKALDFAFMADGYGHETKLFGSCDGKEKEIDWWNNGAGADPNEFF